MKAVCPNCGKPSARVRLLQTYRYKESGLANMWLRGGVTETTCPDCRKRHIRIEKEAQLLQVIALGLLMKPGFLTGREMRFVRGACEMSQAALARALKVRRATVSEREARSYPNATLAEEIWLRVVLLDSFRSQLSSAGSDFLTQGHHKSLEKFTVEFCEEALRFAAHMLRKLRMTAAMDENGKLWRLDKAA